MLQLSYTWMIRFLGGNAPAGFEGIVGSGSSIWELVEIVGGGRLLGGTSRYLVSKNSVSRCSGQVFLANRL